MIMPSTAARSRFAREKMLRSRMPHSSAVCSRMVRRRQRPMRLPRSKAPIVILVFPASRARSIGLCGTDSAGEDRDSLARVFVEEQEAGLVQARCRTVHHFAVQINTSAAAAGIGRAAGELRDRVVRRDLFGAGGGGG